MDHIYNKQQQLLKQHQQLHLLKFEFEDMKESLDEIIELYKNKLK